MSVVDCRYNYGQLASFFRVYQKQSQTPKLIVNGPMPVITGHTVIPSQRTRSILAGSDQLIRIVVNAFGNGLLDQRWSAYERIYQLRFARTVFSVSFVVAGPLWQRYGY